MTSLVMLTDVYTLVLANTVFYSIEKTFCTILWRVILILYFYSLSIRWVVWGSRRSFGRWTSFRILCWATRAGGCGTSTRYATSTSSTETDQRSTPYCTITRAVAGWEGRPRCRWTCSLKRSSSTSSVNWPPTSLGKFFLFPLHLAPLYIVWIFNNCDYIKCQNYNH